MKKKVIIVSGIAGVFILGLCAKFIANNRDVPVIENTAVEERVVSDESNEKQPEREKPEGIVIEEIQGLLEAEQQNKITIPQRVDFVQPVVKLDGEEGKLRYNWNSKSIRVDEDTLLLVSDCYFPEEKLQQKIFFLAETPYFIPHEVFRQDSKIWDEESHPPYELEERIRFPHLVDGGYVYELDGRLYFLVKDFREASLLYDLHQIMGDMYSFSPTIVRTCDVTEDASRMIACTDEGLYEYDLESGERKLLESAYFAHHEIILAEGDCACGQCDYRFDGPVKVEYALDEQSYAFLTGTEETEWGDITGIVLRSGEGETLYQKEPDHMYDFKWVESEDTVYLAAFYTEQDEEGMVDVAWLMDRVDVNTGEVMTFEAPKEIYWGSCCHVGFLDTDTLFYINYHRQKDDKEEEKNDKDIFEIYRLASGERQDLETVGDVDWEIMVLDEDGYETVPVRYPK